MNVESTDCPVTSVVKCPAFHKRRTYAGRNGGPNLAICVPKKRHRRHYAQEHQSLSPSKTASPRSAPPHAHLRARPRTPKLQTRTFSSEPSSTNVAQFDSNFSCSAIPAAPLEQNNQFFTCSYPSDISLFRISRRVSCNKVLPCADSTSALGSEPPTNSLQSDSKQRMLRYDGAVTRQRPPRQVRSPSLQHPSLEPVGQVGAELLLQDRPVGAFVFRSGSGQCMFLSWKTGGQTFKHSKIMIEFARGQRAPKLHLQREVYTDLNEIVSRYITPLAKYVSALCKHPSFCSANSIHEVFKTLFERQELHAVFEKQQQLYVIAPFHTRPGPYCHSFVVVFIQDGDPVKIRFQVTPNGYFVLGRRCTTPDTIIHCLMENYKIQSHCVN